MTTTYAELIDAYVADPGPHTLAPLRDGIRRAANFDPDLAPADLFALTARGEHAAAADAVRRQMPGALLSPMMHAVLADALTHLGQPGAAREATLARLALRSITDSGDGSVERPWSVLRVSDEYDVLRSRDLRSVEQSLTRDGDRWLDRHRCDDDSVHHFDVTEIWRGR